MRAPIIDIDGCNLI